MPRNWASVDKMKYKKDSLSFAFTMLGLVANLVYFFLLYKNNHNFFYSWLMGISVIYNLIFMLLVFLAGEEVKAYRRRYSYLLFALGIVQFLRMFFYPLLALGAEIISMSTYLTLAGWLLVSGVFLLCGAIISFWRSTILMRYLEGKIKFPPANEV